MLRWLDVREINDLFIFSWKKKDYDVYCFGIVNDNILLN